MADDWRGVPLGDAPNESRIPCHDPSDRTVADIPLKQEPDKERRGRSNTTAARKITMETRATRS